MKKIFIILLLFFGVGWGCQQDKRDDAYLIINNVDWPIKFSANKNDPLYESFKKAIEFWNNGIDLKIVSLEDKSNNTFESIEMPNNQGSIEGIVSIKNGCHIIVDVKSSQAMIAHEIGHCLGFSHSTNKNSIMNHYTKENAIITNEIRKIIIAKFAINKSISY